MATSSHDTSHDVLGHFSMDEQGVYHHDHSSKRFFFKPRNEPDYDLLEGHENYETLMGSDEPKPKSMMNLLTWMKNEQKMLLEKGHLQAIHGTQHYRLGVNFVGRHGVLSDLLKSHVWPERREIAVTLFRGTFYLEITRGGGDPSCEQNARTSIYAGRKFRQHVTSVDDQQPNTSLPVNANVGYYAVMTASCVGQSLLFSVEVHAERQGSQDLPPRNYLKVKTKKAGTKLNRYKSMDWWADCTLSGVPEVVCGNRDDESGRAKSVKMYRTSDIPINQNWTPDDAFKNFHSLLNNIRETVTDDNFRSVYRLVLEKEAKGPGPEAWKFTNEGKYPGDYVILPAWYINEVLGGE